MEVPTVEVKREDIEYFITVRLNVVTGEMTLEGGGASLAVTLGMLESAKIELKRQDALRALKAGVRNGPRIAVPGGPLGL